MPDSPGSVLLLSRSDVTRLLTMDECISAVEDAFRQFGEGRTDPPGILGTHLEGGGFHIKAAALSVRGRRFFAAKTNANFPRNPTRHRLPTIQGIVLLFDAENGRPLAIMDSTEITALRTAAATAVAAKYLAAPDARTLTVVGCGVQGRMQARALTRVLPVEEIWLFDIDSSRSDALARELSAELPADVSAVSSFEEATGRSDVIVTCTTSTVPFLRREHVRNGAFVAAVGADNEEKRELDVALLAASRVVPDVLTQAQTIGELHHAFAAGALSPNEIDADLGQIIARPGSRPADIVTVFDSTGMALQDVAAACALYDRARESGTERCVALT
ncbi:MAG TPA: ornithine cyclodeaminase family protein [Vicinamibacterales bacterium]